MLITTEVSAWETTGSSGAPFARSGCGRGSGPSHHRLQLLLGDHQIADSACTMPADAGLSGVVGA